MNLYTVSFFVHMLGLIALFGAYVLLQNVGVRLRAAETWRDVRTLLGTVTSLRGMFPAGGVLLLLSGMEMTRERWTFETPWVVVGTAIVVIFAIVGGVVLGRGFGDLARIAATSEGPIDAGGRARLTDRALWVPTYAMNGATLGLVWVMSTKPDWAIAVGVPLALLLIGGWMGANLSPSGRIGGVRETVAPGDSR